MNEKLNEKQELYHRLWLISMAASVAIIAAYAIQVYFPDSAQILLPLLMSLCLITMSLFRGAEFDAKRKKEKELCKSEQA